MNSLLTPLKIETIIEKLKTVIDPEIGINIVDLGLIYEIRIDDEAKCIEIKMTLTTSGCPMGNIILSDVENAVDEGFPEYKSQTELVWEPAWDFGRISAEGLKILER